MLRRTIGAALLICAVGGTCGFAQDEPPAIRQFDIATTETLGAAIYKQDQEAWKATDLLFAKYSEPDLDSEKVHGWIFDQPASGDIVRFVRDGVSGPEAAYDVSFGSGAPSGPDVPKDRTLSPDDLAQFSARTLALKSIDQPCASNYNTVAVKDPQSAGWLVWALMATTDPDVIQGGRHFRFTISADGKHIVSRDALSRGCFAMSYKTLKDQSDVIGFTYAQAIAAKIPVETNVWLNMLHKMPIYVITRDSSEWKIENGAITRAKP